ncbi:MAG: HAD family phosphatase [Cypionkella sp.]
MSIHALLWDMDGTLLDSEPAHAGAFHDALCELGLRVSRGFHDQLLGVSDDQVHRALIGETGVTLTLTEWRAVKWRHYQRHAGNIQLRHGVAALARQCADEGMAMAVVSNSTADEVALCLAASGLAGLFRTTVSRADVAQGKPDPAGYLLAAQRLGVAAADCAVIEDSPVGAAAGVAAGMLTFYHPQSFGGAVPNGAIYVSPDQSLASKLRAVLYPRLTV